MVVKEATKKLKEILNKYKFAIVILCIGLILLLLPEKETSEEIKIDVVKESANMIHSDDLSSILQSIEGAGQVQVMLSVATGEKTVYQTNTDNTLSGDSNSNKIDTVIITDSQRNETGLVNQVNPPTYLGAIIVCQGANNPSVKLAITQAVSKITGLGTDSICVLKMK